MAHMQSSQYADAHFETEFEVLPIEIEGLDGDALDSYLNDRAVDALTESGLVAIWFEEV
jgi:hypothetical protein